MLLYLGVSYYHVYDFNMWSNYNTDFRFGRIGTNGNPWQSYILDGKGPTAENTLKSASQHRAFFFFFYARDTSRRCRMLVKKKRESVKTKKRRSLVLKNEIFQILDRAKKKEVKEKKRTIVTFHETIL